jgi:hypothetical protein
VKEKRGDHITFIAPWQRLKKTSCWRSPEHNWSRQKSDVIPLTSVAVIKRQGNYCPKSALGAPINNPTEKGGVLNDTTKPLIKQQQQPEAKYSFSLWGFCQEHPSRDALDKDDGKPAKAPSNRQDGLQTPQEIAQSVHEPPPLTLPPPRHEERQLSHHPPTLRVHLEHHPRFDDLCQTPANENNVSDMPERTLLDLVGRD